MACTFLLLGRSQLSSSPSYPSTRVWTSNVERSLILTVSGRKRYFFYHQPWKMQININRQKVSRYFNSNLTISADLHWIHWNARKTRLWGCTIYWVRVLCRNSIGDFLGEGVLETIVGLEIVLCLFNLLYIVICLVNAPNRNIEKLPRNVQSRGRSPPNITIIHRSRGDTALGGWLF